MKDKGRIGGPLFVFLIGADTCLSAFEYFGHNDICTAHQTSLLEIRNNANLLLARVDHRQDEDPEIGSFRACHENLAHGDPQKRLNCQDLLMRMF